MPTPNQKAHLIINHSDTFNDTQADESEESLTFIIGKKPRGYEQLQEQKEEIVVITTSMPLMRTISFISSLVFSIALFIRFLFNYPQLTYIFISLPLSITFISLTMYLNSAIMLQTILPKEKPSRQVIFASYICLNCAGLSLLIFICLLSLRLDRLIMSDYSTVVVIPLIICGCIYLSYALVIIPLLNKEIEIDWVFTFITCIDALCIMLFVYLGGKKLDYSNIGNNGQEYSFFYAFIPLYICLIINLSFYAMNNQKHTTGELMRLFGIGLILIGVIAFQVKFDNIITNKNHWIDIALIALGYYAISFEFLFGTFSNDIHVIEKNASISLK